MARATLNLANPTRDGVRVHAGGLRHSRDPAPTQLPGLHTQQQTTLPLVQVRA
jgi:hypothetical protein